MDHLSKEQMHLLQQNLTYEVYEQFMDMFKGSGPGDELIPSQYPDDPHVTVEDSMMEQAMYIIEVAKEHPYWGEQHGWGDNRVYINLPNDPRSVTHLSSYSLRWLYTNFTVWYNFGRSSMIDTDFSERFFKGTHRSHLVSFLDSLVDGHKKFNKEYFDKGHHTFDRNECLPVTN